MSSMVSYTLGGTASRKTVLNSWLRYFIENENKLINDLEREEEFKILWTYDILNKNKISSIKNEFKLLYSDWTDANMSNRLREEILKNMEYYIYTLKESLLKESLLKEKHMRAKHVREELNFIFNSKNNKVQESEDIKLEEKENYVETIEFYLQKIKNLNQEVFLNEKSRLENIKDFTSQRAKVLLNSLKLKLYELAKNKIKLDICKNNISTIYNSLKSSDLKDLSLIEEIENFLKTDNYDEVVYNNLYKILDKKYQDLIMAQEENKIINNIINSLNKLDYLIIDDTEDLEVKLKNKENIILDIKDKDYAIFLKINEKGELLTRFVRKIDSEDDKKNITDSQRIIDKENLKHWCSLLDKFSKELLSDEIIVDTNTIEDAETDVIYHVDRTKSNDLQENKKINKMEML